MNRQSKKIVARDVVKGARNANPETVQMVRQGIEYRVTQQYARETVFK